MKKVNFEIIFKIIVLIQLTIILVLLISSLDNENGRYEVIKTHKKDSWGNTDDEEIYILDTQTGIMTKSDE